jgi:hypothetical protein
MSSLKFCNLPSQAFVMPPSASPTVPMVSSRTGNNPFMTEDGVPIDYWIQTAKGHKISFTDMSKNVYDIEDIATSLSRQCRFNGHCARFYSVAEHCVHMANAWWSQNKSYGSPACLLHDASEAYVCDIPTPLKNYLGKTYRDLEAKIMKGIWEQHHISLRCEMTELRKHDHNMLYTEFLVLVDKKDEKVANWNFDPFVETVDCVIKCWSPEKARKEFLKAAKNFGLYTPPKAVSVKKTIP